MDFDWSPIKPAEWRELLAAAPRANLLQSWPHAVAARLHDQMMSRHARIIDAGRTIGIMQIQEIRIGPVHVIRLHRGPLWFDAADDAERWRRFLHAFDGEFPQRIGRWRRLLPEMGETAETQALLREAGFRQKGAEPYRTIMLDLRPLLDDIRKRLKGKWRNALSQAERSKVSAVCDHHGLSAKAFLTGYATDKGTRHYRGAKPKRLATMIAAAIPEREAMILNAVKDDDTIAAMLMFRHGRTATYQAGWTSNAGRNARAHHLLLWKAIEDLKGQGVHTLDLGGIHPQMAEGVTRFKEGLGGRMVSLPGIYS